MADNNNNNAGKKSLSKSISRDESVREIRDDAYPRQFLNNLTKLHLEDPGWLCDVTFLVEDAEVPAHRIVMSAFSDFFRCLFKMQSSERISLHGDVSVDVFRAIVSFAYTGNIVITAENVQDLLTAANYYGCASLVEEASDFMVDLLDGSNVFDIWELAERLSIEKLAEACRLIVVENFEAINADPSIQRRLYQVPPAVMEAVLKSPELYFRHPETGLFLYADERQKMIIASLKAYCVANEIRGDRVVRMLRNCVSWIVLAGDDDASNLLDEFGEDAAAAKEMLHSAKQKRDLVRKAFITDPENPDWVYGCHRGHSSQIMSKTGRDVFYFTHENFNLDELFIACDCDRLFYGTETRMIGAGAEPHERTGYILRKLLDNAGIDASSSEFGSETLGMYSCSFDCGVDPTADGRRVGSPQNDFLPVAEAREHITAIKVTTRLWDEIEIIRSLELTYSSGWGERFGGKGETLNTHEIILDQGEHVIDIEAHAGRMLHSLEFTIGKLRRTPPGTDFIAAAPTLETRKEGPFGGDGGKKKKTKPAILVAPRQKELPLNHYLVGFAGKLMHTRGQECVTHFAPVWRSMECYTYEHLITDRQFHSRTRLGIDSYGKDLGSEASGKKRALERNCIFQ